MKPLKKTFIAAVILSTAFALSANAAMAAASQAHKTAAATHVTRHVATARLRAPAQYQATLPNIFGALFGLPMPVTVTAPHYTSASRNDGGGGYDPTFDAPTATVDVDNSQSQAAIDASDQAMQEEDQSLQDLDASVAAAEQQNDEAQQMATQDMMNEVNSQ